MQELKNPAAEATAHRAQAMDTQANDSAAEYALQLAEAGFPVFPCRRDKSPWTARGFHDASTDPDAIREWWRRWPDALIGIPTGPTSDLLVIDIDPDGADWYSEHAAELAAGRVHKTKRGHHLLYRHVDGVRCSAGRIAPGVDVRSDGGYIVWWPAHGLEAVGGLDDVSDAPAWLLDLLREPAAKPGQAAAQAAGDTIPEGRRDDTLASLAGSMRRRGLSAEEIAPTLHAINESRCRPPLDRADVDRIAASVGRYPAQDTQARPVVQLTSLAESVDAAAGILSHAPIYVRGGQLVRPLRLGTPRTEGGITRRSGAMTLAPVDPAWMRLELDRAVTWQRWDARSKDWKDTAPPADIPNTLCAAPDVGNWPTLRGVVQHPVVVNGRIVSTPGYDHETGLLLDCAAGWPMPEATDRAAAVKAVSTLEDLLRHFPFASEADKAVALSMMVTAVARQTLPTAPMHAVDAPEPGTGKSLLVDAASILATGQRAPVLDYGRDETEAAKRLDGALLAGDELVSIDNIERPLEGATLCQVITQTHRRVRPLGTSVLATVPCTMMLCATGNNLVLRGDIVRRALVCRLDARTERPELRQFDQDLLSEARDRRQELVTAILTILAAYAQAGYPSPLPPLGSFTEWSRTVRAALVWAGSDDPVEAMSRTRDADPSRQEITAVLNAWHDHFGDRQVKGSEVIAACEINTPLMEALTAICRGGKLTGRGLGYWLRNTKDRRAGALVLVQGNIHGGSNTWRVVSDLVDMVDIGGHVSTATREVSGFNTDKHGGEPETSPPSPPCPPCPQCAGEGCPWCEGAA
ncbi:MAG TPA: bifunctional DNA primase/polymerase [Thiohalobacter sp.]|nr:bifunctional DNA primase/polymerase [Thiohalobacter sp.]